MARPLPLSPPSEGPNIGARLRALRQARGYTLDDLATAAGVTKGFLSRIEHDKTSPSVATLVALCSVMSVDIGELFETSESALVQHDSAPQINLGGTRVDERLMTPRGQSQFQLVRTDVEPGGHGGAKLYTVNSQFETLYVDLGRVELRFSDQQHQLKAGDCLTFAGTEPHTWRNLSDTRPARLLWVLIPAPWHVTPLAEGGPPAS